MMEVSANSRDLQNLHTSAIYHDISDQSRKRHFRVIHCIQPTKKKKKKKKKNQVHVLEFQRGHLHVF